MASLSHLERLPPEILLIIFEQLETEWTVHLVRRTSKTMKRATDSVLSEKGKRLAGLECMSPWQLYFAMKRRQLATIKELLEAGFPADQPMHIEHDSRLPFGERVLAFPKPQDHYEHRHACSTPLREVFRHERINEPTATLLLSYGANIDQLLDRGAFRSVAIGPDLYGTFTLLGIAIADGNIETVKYLILHGASSQVAVSPHPVTALMLAAAYGNPHVVRMCVDWDRDTTPEMLLRAFVRCSWGISILFRMLRATLCAKNPDGSCYFDSLSALEEMVSSKSINYELVRKWTKRERVYPGPDNASFSRYMQAFEGLLYGIIWPTRGPKEYKIEPQIPKVDSLLPWVVSRLRSMGWCDTSIIQKYRHTILRSDVKAMVDNLVPSLRDESTDHSHDASDSFRIEQSEQSFEQPVAFNLGDLRSG